MKKGVLAVLGSALTWALLPVFSSLLYARGVDALSAAAMRAYLVALMLIVLSARLQPIRRFQMSDVRHFALTGLLAVTGTYSFYLLAIERLNFAMAAILLYTAPAFVTLFSRLLYKEKITPKKALTLVLTFIGCFLVVGAYDITKLQVNALGILFGLCSGLCFSMLTVLGNRRMAQYGSQLNCTYMALFGALFFVFVRPPWMIPAFTPTTLLLYAALAAVGSVIPSMLYLNALQSGLNGGDASIIATLEPVFVALIGAAAFGQALSALQIAGVVLTLLGACLSALARNDAP